MLYRTHHHPFLCKFNPFSHSFFITPTPSNFPPPPKSLSQKMECVQGALVTVFGSEPAPKTAPFSVDDLFVDELLDFSNEEEQEEQDEEEEQEQPRKLDEPEEKEKNCSAPPAPEKSDVSDFGPLPETELAVPAEGLESLEWLSHFVEDSFSDYSLAGKLTSSPAANRPQPVTPAKEQACFSTPVQTKARTKRARTGVRVWPVLSPSLTESSTSSSSSTSSATSFLFPAPPAPGHTGEFFISVNPGPTKKQRRKTADAGSGPGQPRRCNHCGVTKTPQWRAGPLGSKTLCNACGVRFKSGRLLPEYRPACSPTFSSEVHSNNHRKVLEMRRKKESEIEPATGPPPPVQSF